MVYHQTPIAACKPTHNSITVTMSGSIKAPCDQSQLALIDILMSTAVIGALGFLLYPSITFTYMKFRQISYPFISLLIDEVTENPLVYVSLGVSTVCLTVAMWVILVCMGGKKCGKIDCKGLRNGAKFDIQIENEDCVKNSSGAVIKKGLFETPSDHHRELEAELRKMAPLNGRAVLLFRTRCGCVVGRMEVAGFRKTPKIRK